MHSLGYPIGTPSFTVDQEQVLTNYTHVRFRAMLLLALVQLHPRSVSIRAASSGYALCIEIPWLTKDSSHVMPCKHARIGLYEKSDLSLQLKHHNTTTTYRGTS